MKCKDIPDQPILKFLAKNKGQPHSCFDGEFDVRLAMPKNIADKLPLAKIRMMIRRGLVSGCGCGCRGNFTITEKGINEIDL